MVPTMTCAMLEQEIIMLRLLIKEAVEALESAIPDLGENKRRSISSLVARLGRELPIKRG